MAVGGWDGQGGRRSRDRGGEQALRTGRDANTGKRRQGHEEFPPGQIRENTRFLSG